MSAQPDAPDAADDVVIGLDADPHLLGRQLAVALSMPTAVACHGLDADQRLVFWVGLAACLSGMMEASIGYQRTQDALEVVMRLKSAGDTGLRH